MSCQNSLDVLKIEKPSFIRLNTLGRVLQHFYQEATFVTSISLLSEKWSALKKKKKDMNLLLLREVLSFDTSPHLMLETKAGFTEFSSLTDISVPFYRE